MVEFRSVVSELEKWKEGKGLILRGQDGTFCAGGDLDFEGRILKPEYGLMMFELMQDAMWRLENLPLVSVALIQGAAVAGGAELTTACDFRIITENGKIGFVHRKVGVSTGFGGGSRLVNIVGRSKALELLLSGKILTAREAVGCGLANNVLPEKNAVSAADEWLDKMLAGNTYAATALKQVVMSATESDLKSALVKEKAAFGSLWSGPAHTQSLLNRQEKKAKIQPKIEKASKL